MMIRIDLPIPPSVNHIWRHVGRRSYRSPRYTEWIKRADVHVVSNGQWPKHKIIGPFEAEFFFDRTLVRKGSDLDNRIKPVMDWCVSRKLVSDDKHCVKLVAAWVESGQAPHGCRVILQPYRQP